MMMMMFVSSQDVFNTFLTTGISAYNANLRDKTDVIAENHKIMHLVRFLCQSEGTHTDTHTNTHTHTHTHTHTSTVFCASINSRFRQVHGTRAVETNVLSAPLKMY